MLSSKIQFQKIKRNIEKMLLAARLLMKENGGYITPLEAEGNYKTLYPGSERIVQKMLLIFG